LLSLLRCPTTGKRLALEEAHCHGDRVRTGFLVSPTKRIPKERLFAICESLVPRLFPVSRRLCRVPLLGKGLKRLIPVANYVDVLPLDEKQHLEWSLLDTFDWFAPEFDNPQTLGTVRRWLESAGLEGIEVFKAGQVTGRGTAPATRSIGVERPTPHPEAASTIAATHREERA